MRLHKKSIHEFFSKSGVEEKYSQWKGHVLEKLGCFLFLTEPELTIIKRNVRVKNGELDILVGNESISTFWHQLGSPIAVECKNLSEKVSSEKIRIFRSTLRELRIKTGFILSHFGPTGGQYRDVTNLIKETKRQDGINIINMPFVDIEEALKYYSITEHIKKIFYLLY
jgi:hypothetical protein